MTTQNNLCERLAAGYRAQEASRMAQNFEAMHEAQDRARYAANTARVALFALAALGFAVLISAALAAPASIEAVLEARDALSAASASELLQ